MDMWAPGEPNHLTNDLCVRVTCSLDTDTSVQWRTSGCSDKHHVVCEFDEGECNFERHDNITLTLSPNVTYDVTTFNECTSLCLQLPENEEECVAFSVNNAFGGMVCQIYLDSQLLNISDVPTSPMKLSSVNLRRCFQHEVRETPTQYSHTNSDKIPLPANGPCSIANATTSPAPSPYSTTSEIRNTTGTGSQSITTTAVQKAVITEASSDTAETQETTSSDSQNTSAGNMQTATSDFMQSTVITEQSPTTTETQGNTSIKRQTTTSWNEQQATTELVQITDSIGTLSLDTMTEVQGNTPIENSTTSGYKPDDGWNFNTTNKQGNTVRAVQGTTMGAPKSSTATTTTTTAPADATALLPPTTTTTAAATTSTPKTTITKTVTAASTSPETPVKSTLVSAAATNMSVSATSTFSSKALPTSTSGSIDSKWKSSVTAGLKRCRCMCVSKINSQESPKTETSDVIHANTTSRYRRKKVSTYDNTPSHAYVSFSIVIAVFVLMFGFLVALDTKKCVGDIRQNWCR
ncbi:uncharacterized protein [Littorina saxatilis]|uniref:uncharacterized protein n=1 Tax=Littorina saxatilis TaxID=31220 RepID=UPI0038B4751E